MRAFWHALQNWKNKNYLVFNVLNTSLIISVKLHKAASRASSKASDLLFFTSLSVPFVALFFDIIIGLLVSSKYGHSIPV